MVGQALSEVTTRIPIQTDNGVVLLEPLRWDMDGPVWDSTDEIHITYGPGGQRAKYTTNSEEWSQERDRALQGYEIVRDFTSYAYAGERTGGAAAGPVRETGGRPLPEYDRQRAAAAADAIRPERYTAEWPPVHVGSNGYDPRPGPQGGSRTDHRERGASADGASGVPWDQAGARGLPERSHTGIRTHRHCPGCSGHANTRGSWLWLATRAAMALVLGWMLIWTNGIDINWYQYLTWSFVGLQIAILFRPVWREMANATDRRTRGGRH